MIKNNKTLVSELITELQSQGVTFPTNNTKDIRRCISNMLKEGQRKVKIKSINIVRDEVNGECWQTKDSIIERINNL